MLAFSSKHPFVPDPKEDPKATRWIASLSDGSTVFEDKTPHERSAWRRLSEYVKVHNLKVTNLRLEAYNRRVLLIPYKDDDGIAQINGYWHSKKIGALLADNGVQEILDCGIGYVKAKEVFITWVNQDGTVWNEVRQYKDGDLATIINDQP